ncbi:MAG: 4Fe-4S binding protein [Bacteroidales bacterium]
MSKLLSLRLLRIVIAAIFGLLFLFLFIDFSETLPPPFINGLLYFQFTPSLLKFIKVGGLLATGFILVIILTLLFGRVYCSMLCPLGILQDLIARIRRKKARYKFLKPWNIFRYTTLLIVVITVLAGSLFLLNLLDPYSFAGRIFSDLVRPAYYAGNNALVAVFGYFNNYSLHHVDFKSMPWQVITLTSSLTAGLILIAWRWGRIFCNTLCPVGAVLSLISRYSIFKIKIDDKACTACNRCVRTCKATCIDIKSKEIDFSRCVACYNCIDSCNENSIGYKYPLGKKTKTSNKTIKNSSRRGFIAAFTGLVAGSTLLGKAVRTYAQGNRYQNRQREGQKIGKGQKQEQSTVQVSENSTSGQRPNSRTSSASPPGSYSIKEFLNACTACHLCISSCPTYVIQPSVKEWGFFGIMQPHMDFHSGFCNFECTLCGEVCPTGAIRPLQLETKKRAQIGKVKFHKANCIVNTDRTECGACSEHCPTKAVYMVPWQGLLLPEVNDEICIGCGACEYACPTEPYKAIYINGNHTHQVAELPEEMDDSPQESDMDDFPF